MPDQFQRRQEALRLDREGMKLLRQRKEGLRAGTLSRNQALDLGRQATEKMLASLRALKPQA